MSAWAFARCLTERRIHVVRMADPTVKPRPHGRVSIGNVSASAMDTHDVAPSMGPIEGRARASRRRAPDATPARSQMPSITEVT